MSRYKWLKIKWFIKDIITFKHVRVLIFILINPAFALRKKHLCLSTTWYEEIPIGWRKAFGKQLCKDIKQAFKEDKKEIKELRHMKLTWKKAIQFCEIKEKWGTLRLYANASPHIYDVLEHYEDLSQDYCIVCGKPSTRFTLGWVNYICDDCAKLCNHYSIPFIDEEEYYKDKEKYIETHREELEANKSHKEN